MSETEACTATGASLSNKKWRRRVQHAQLACLHHDPAWASGE